MNIIDIKSDIDMKIINKQTLPTVNKQEEDFHRSFIDSPLARSLKEHIDKWYPKVQENGHQTQTGQ